jgi:hypothetical protein
MTSKSLKDSHAEMLRNMFDSTYSWMDIRDKWFATQSQGKVSAQARDQYGQNACLLIARNMATMFSDSSSFSKIPTSFYHDRDHVYTKLIDRYASQCKKLDLLIEAGASCDVRNCDGMHTLTLFLAGLSYNPTQLEQYGGNNEVWNRIHMHLATYVDKYLLQQTKHDHKTLMAMVQEQYNRHQEKYKRKVSLRQLLTGQYPTLAKLLPELISCENDPTTTTICKPRDKWTSSLVHDGQLSVIVETTRPTRNQGQYKSWPKPTSVRTIDGLLVSIDNGVHTLQELQDLLITGNTAVVTVSQLDLVMNLFDKVTFFRWIYKGDVCTCKKEDDEEEQEDGVFQLQELHPRLALFHVTKNQPNIRRWVQYLVPILTDDKLACDYYTSMYRSQYARDGFRFSTRFVFDFQHVSNAEKVVEDYNGDPVTKPLIIVQSSNGDVLEIEEMRSFHHWKSIFDWKHLVSIMQQPEDFTVLRNSRLQEFFVTQVKRLTHKYTSQLDDPLTSQGSECQEFITRHFHDINNGEEETTQQYEALLFQEMTNEHVVIKSWEDVKYYGQIERTLTKVDDWSTFPDSRLDEPKFLDLVQIRMRQCANPYVDISMLALLDSLLSLSCNQANRALGKHVCDL